MMFHSSILTLLNDGFPADVATQRLVVILVKEYLEEKEREQA